MLISFVSDKNNAQKFSEKIEPPIYQIFAFSENGERIMNFSKNDVRAGMTSRPYRYEIALVNTNLAFTNNNISEEYNNNVIRYKKISHETWKTITIPDGEYNLSELVGHIELVLSENGDSEAFNIYTKEARGCIKLVIKKGYQFDFGVSKINKVFGLNAEVYSEGVYIGPNTVDICGNMSKQVIINCNLVNSNDSRVNGKPSKALYTTSSANHPSCYKFIEPKNLIYLPIDTELELLDEIEISITDENGKPYNMTDASDIALSIRKAKA